MRRMMTREVTETTIKIAKLTMVDGEVKAVELPDEVEYGNIRLERAQRMMNKKFEDDSVTVMQVIPKTTIYEMPVQTFVDNAEVKEVK